MNTANNFYHHRIDYRRLRPNSKIFIPLDAFAPHPNEESDIGEYLGSVTAGVAHMGGMSGIATALHLIEMLEPAFEVDRLNLSHEKTRTLQFMYQSQRVRNPHGRGTRAGIWIEAKMAYDMGLISIPQEYSDLRAQFTNQSKNFREDHTSKRPPSLFKTTNDYSQHNHGSAYGRFRRKT